jgi:hypothetical protein
MSPRWGSTPRLTDRQSQCDFDFAYEIKSDQGGDQISQVASPGRSYVRVNVVI